MTHVLDLFPAEQMGLQRHTQGLKPYLPCGARMTQISARRRLNASRGPWMWLTAIVTLLASMLAPAGASATVGPGWMRAGDMTDVRTSFPAVTLPSGKVLVASGSSADLFDPANGTFSRVATLTVDRGAGLSATLLQNGKVLLAGGQAGDSAQATAELFDPASGTSSPTGSMSDTRSFHSATLLTDGRVLIVGGGRSIRPESSVASAEIYDPVSGTFSPTGGMTAPRNITRQRCSATGGCWSPGDTRTTGTCWGWRRRRFTTRAQEPSHLPQTWRPVAEITRRRFCVMGRCW